MNEPNADEWKDTATRLRVENEQLRAHIQQHVAQLAHTENEVADFLERLANRMASRLRPEERRSKADECRAKARELRGET